MIGDGSFQYSVQALWTAAQHQLPIGFGCRAVDVETAEELEHEFKTALSAESTTVIVVPTQPQAAML